MKKYLHALLMRLHLVRRPHSRYAHITYRPQPNFRRIPALARVPASRRHTS